MAKIEIQNLDPRVHRELCTSAARRGITVEDEARRILTEAILREGPENRAELFLSIFGPRHGVTIRLPNRSERPKDPTLE